MNLYFSIVIPLYNKEKYIKNTIESILKQTYPYFEIIVVDDGSKDNSVDIVKKIDDERIKLFLKENTGVSDTRNYGIMKAQNKYVVFIDADDWWSVDFLEKMYNLIKKFPDAGIYSSSYAEVDSGVKNPVITFRYIKEHESILDYVKVFSKCKITPINTSSVVIKREVLEKYKFDPRISTGEDLILWLKIADDYKLAYINEVLSFYNREVTDSLSRKLIPLEKNFMMYIYYYFESPSVQMKYLIDSLVVRMLRPYYLYDKSTGNVEKILNFVDLKKQGLFHYLFYKLPKPLVKFIYTILKK